MNSINIIDSMFNFMDNTFNSMDNTFNSDDKKNYYLSFSSPKKFVKELLERGENPLNVAVKYGLYDKVIYIDDLLRNNPRVIEKYDIKPQWHDERFCISWYQVRTAMRNKDYKMVKLLCSRLRSRYFKLKTMVAYRTDQTFACSEVIKMGIRDFDKDINEFFIGLFCKKGYTREQYAFNRIDTIMEVDNNEVLEFYKPVFEISHFNQAVFNGCINCVSWMETHQPDICVIEENHRFFEYPFCDRPYDLVKQNNLPALKVYFKYIGSLIKPCHYYYLLRTFTENNIDNQEMFELLTSLESKYFPMN